MTIPVTSKEHQDISPETGLLLFRQQTAWLIICFFIFFGLRSGMIVSGCRRNDVSRKKLEKRSPKILKHSFLLLVVSLTPASTNAA